MEATQRALKDLTNQLIELLAAMSAEFGLNAVQLALTALVTSLLWLWFAVPFGLPALSLAAAAGLTVLVQQAGPWTPTSKDDRDRIKTMRPFAVLAEAWTRKREGIMRDLYLLLLGWIIHSNWPVLP